MTETKGHKTGRKWHKSQGDFTRTALIETAESMFAEFGVETVSLRQIGAAVGSLNNNVIAYHFGSKAALIHEIYRHRLPGFDARRGELLAKFEAEGGGNDLVALLRILWQPIFEQIDAQGRRSYARFFMRRIHAGLGGLLEFFDLEFPVANQVKDRINRLLPPEFTALNSIRWNNVTGMILHSIQYIDREAPGNNARAQGIFDETLVMAAAALTAQRDLSR